MRSPSRIAIPTRRITRVDGQSVNYMRNSVKVVVDAYDGTTTFYVFDNQDPILAAYRGIFPSLFKDASADAGRVAQACALSRVTAQVTSGGVRPLSHDQSRGLLQPRGPVDRGHGGRAWARAERSTTQAMEPNFVLMKLPGESGVEFVEILPFTPANRNNLIGWIAGRSDGEHYGTSVVYDFPKTKLVDGPLQIEARIDQNAQLSGQLTLWNQQGSHVRRGTLLVIPCGTRAAVCGADLSAGRPQPDAGVAAGGAGAAGPAGLRTDVRGGVGIAVWRRGFVDERANEQSDSLRRAGAECCIRNAVVFSTGVRSQFSDLPSGEGSCRLSALDGGGQARRSRPKA